MKGCKSASEVEAELEPWKSLGHVFQERAARSWCHTDLKWCHSGRWERSSHLLTGIGSYTMRRRKKK